MDDKYYVIDANYAAHEVSVQCFQCSRMDKLSKMFIDPEGPSFKAYYCSHCLPEAMAMIQGGLHNPLLVSRDHLGYFHIPMYKDGFDPQ